MSNHYELLNQNRAQAKLGGGADKQAARKKKGKLTCWERIDLLFDTNSFVEIGGFVQHECQDFGLEHKRFLGDGVITGWGKIQGRTVYAYAQDFTVLGGSLSETNAQKIVTVIRLAAENGTPIIAMCDSGGARIHEGIGSLGGYARIFRENVKASGVIPQLSIILGPCAGGAVYSPALTDFIFMVEGSSHMFITGPDVIKTVTSQQVTFDELGGAAIHTTTSGVADIKLASEIDAIQMAKTWLSYMPSNNIDAPPTTDNPDHSEDPQIIQSLQRARQSLKDIVPNHANIPYNMEDVITAVMDPDSFYPIKPQHAPNIITGLARLGGHVVGIVGNNPDHCAGVLDIHASCKAARFVRFCDSFHIPIVSFVDVPGFLPGVDQEKGGIIRHGAKLLYAYCEAQVPKLSVITRKAYGGAYIVMSSKHIGGDWNLAWPGAEIAVMGAEAACNIIFRKQIQESKHPDKEREDIVSAYAKKFSNPYQAAQKGLIDIVIHPEETRHYLIQGLLTSMGKRTVKVRRKHGNIPL